MHRRHVLIGAAGLLLLGNARAQGVSRVTVGPGGETMFVLGGAALMPRKNSNLELLEDGFRLVSGAVLAVFGPGKQRQLRTPTATIGIRGTAVYLETQRTGTYVCTCYGETRLAGADDPAANETVRVQGRRHGEPRFVAARGAPQKPASMQLLNHTDAELERLERLLRG
jgi:hypothetical protein